MKRFWIGVWVLLLVLAAGLGLTALVQRAYAPICHQLDRAAQAALEEDWAEATALFAASQTRWTDWSDAASAFTDHSLLEAAEGLLAQLQIYAQARDATAFAAGCAQLSRLIHSITESQSPSWQNLL